MGFFNNPLGSLRSFADDVLGIDDSGGVLGSVSNAFANVEDITRNVLKDETFQQIAIVAASVTPGMQWTVPLISGAGTWAAGGDLKDISKAIAVSYVAGELGQAAGEYIGDAALTGIGGEGAAIADLGAFEKAAVGFLSSGATSGTVAFVQGRDPVEAFKIGGIGGAIGSLANSAKKSLNIGEDIDVTDPNVSTEDLVKNAISNVAEAKVTAYLQGADLQGQEIAVIEALASSIPLTVQLANDFAQERGLSPEEAGVTTDIINSAVVSVFTDQKIDESLMPKLITRGNKALNAKIDVNVRGQLDKVLGNYDLVENATQNVEDSYRDLIEYEDQVNKEINAVDKWRSLAEATYYDAREQFLRAEKYLKDRGIEFLQYEYDTAGFSGNTVTSQSPLLVVKGRDKIEQVIDGKWTTVNRELKKAEYLYRDARNRMAVSQSYFDGDEYFPNTSLAGTRRLGIAYSGYYDNYRIDDSGNLVSNKIEEMPSKRFDYEGVNKALEEALGPVDDFAREEKLARKIANVLRENPDKLTGEYYREMANDPESEFSKLYDSYTNSIDNYDTALNTLYTDTDKLSEELKPAIKEIRKEFVEAMHEGTTGGGFDAEAYNSINNLPSDTDPYEHYLESGRYSNVAVNDDQYGIYAAEIDKQAIRLADQYAKANGLESWRNLSTGEASQLHDYVMGKVGFNPQAWSELNINDYGHLSGDGIYNEVPQFQASGKKLSEIMATPEIAGGDPIPSDYNIYGPDKRYSLSAEGTLVVTDKGVESKIFDPEKNAVVETSVDPTSGNTIASIGESIVDFFIGSAEASQFDSSGVLIEIIYDKAASGEDISVEMQAASLASEGFLKDLYEILEASDSDTLALIAQGVGKAIVETNYITKLFGIDPSKTPLGQFGESLQKIGLAATSDQFKDEVETLNKKMQEGEGLGRIAAIGGAIWEHPTTFLMEYALKEGVGTGLSLVAGGIASKVVSGGLKIAARNSADEAAEKIAKEMGRKAGFYTAVSTDVIQSMGANGKEAWDSTYALAKQQGLTDGQAEKLANDVAHEQMITAGLVTAALGKWGGGLALEKTFFGDSAGAKVGAALFDNIKVMAREAGAEGVEEGLLKANLEKHLYKLDPNRDVTGEIAAAATLGTIIGATVTGGITTTADGAKVIKGVSDNILANMINAVGSDNANVIEGLNSLADSDTDLKYIAYETALADGDLISEGQSLAQGYGQFRDQNITKFYYGASKSANPVYQDIIDKALSDKYIPVNARLSYLIEGSDMAGLTPTQLERFDVDIFDPGERLFNLDEYQRSLGQLNRLSTEATDESGVSLREAEMILEDYLNLPDARSGWDWDLDVPIPNETRQIAEILMENFGTGDFTPSEIDGAFAYIVGKNANLTGISKQAYDSVMSEIRERFPETFEKINRDWNVQNSKASRRYKAFKDSYSEAGKSLSDDEAEALIGKYNGIDSDTFALGSVRADLGLIPSESIPPYNFTSAANYNPEDSTKIGIAINDKYGVRDEDLVDSIPRGEESEFVYYHSAQARKVGGYAEPKIAGAITDIASPEELSALNQIARNEDLNAILFLETKMPLSELETQSTHSTFNPAEMINLEGFTWDDVANFYSENFYTGNSPDMISRGNDLANISYFTDGMYAQDLLKERAKDLVDDSGNITKYQLENVIKDYIFEKTGTELKTWPELALEMTEQGYPINSYNLKRLAWGDDGTVAGHKGNEHLGGILGNNYGRYGANAPITEGTYDLESALNIMKGYLGDASEIAVTEQQAREALANVGITQPTYAQIKLAMQPISVNGYYAQRGDEFYDSGIYPRSDYYPEGFRSKQILTPQKLEDRGISDTVINQDEIDAINSRNEAKFNNRRMRSNLDSARRDITQDRNPDRLEKYKAALGEEAYNEIKYGTVGYYAVRVNPKYAIPLSTVFDPTLEYETVPEPIISDGITANIVNSFKPLFEQAGVDFDGNMESFSDAVNSVFEAGGLNKEDVSRLFDGLGFTPSDEELDLFFYPGVRVDEVGSEVQKFVDAVTYSDQEIVDMLSEVGYTPSEAEIEELSSRRKSEVTVQTYADMVDKDSTTEAEAKQIFEDLGYDPLIAELTGKFGQDMTEQEATQIITDYVDPRQVTKDEALEIFTEKGYSPSDDELQAFVGIRPESTVGDEISAYVDPRQLTESEVRDYFDIIGYDATEAEVADLAGQGPEADLIAGLAEYADVRQVELDELEAIAEEAGYKLTPSDIERFTGKGADALYQEQVLADAAEFFGANVITEEEVKAVMDRLGYEATAEEIASFVGQKNQLEQESKVTSYVNANTVTEAEVTEFLNSLGYNPSEEEVSMFTGQIEQEPLFRELEIYADQRIVTPEEVDSAFQLVGYDATDAEIQEFAGNYDESYLQGNIDAYVDPRMVSEQEARDEFSALGYEPTDQELSGFIGQRDQSTLSEDIGVYVDPRQVTTEEVEAAFSNAGYNPTPEEIQEFVGIRPQDQTESLISNYAGARIVTADDARSYFEQFGYEPTPEEIEQFVGQFNKDAQLEQVGLYVDRNTVTDEEIANAFSAIGHDPTPEDIVAIRDLGLTDAQLDAEAGLYVANLSPTPEEVAAKFAELGYNPSADEVSQFTKRMTDDQMATRVATYVNRKSVTMDEVLGAVSSIGVDPSILPEGMLDKYVGQFDEMETLAGAIKDIDAETITADEAAMFADRFDPPLTEEQVQSFIGLKNEQEALDDMAMLSEEIRILNEDKATITPEEVDEAFAALGIEVPDSVRYAVESELPDGGLTDQELQEMIAERALPNFTSREEVAQQFADQGYTPTEEEIDLIYDPTAPDLITADRVMRYVQDPTGYDPDAQTGVVDIIPEDQLGPPVEPPVEPPEVTPEPESGIYTIDDVYAERDVAQVTDSDVIRDLIGQGNPEGFINTLGEGAQVDDLGRIFLTQDAAEQFFDNTGKNPFEDFGYQVETTAPGYDSTAVGRMLQLAAERGYLTSTDYTFAEQQGLSLDEVRTRFDQMLVPRRIGPMSPEVPEDFDFTQDPYFGDADFPFLDLTEPDEFNYPGGPQLYVPPEYPATPTTRRTPQPYDFGDMLFRFPGDPNYMEAPTQGRDPYGMFGEFTLSEDVARQYAQPYVDPVTGALTTLGYAPAFLEPEPRQTRGPMDIDPALAGLDLDLGDV